MEIANITIMVVNSVKEIKCIHPHTPPPSPHIKKSKVKEGGTRGRSGSLGGMSPEKLLNTFTVRRVVASAQVCGGFDQIQLHGRACFPRGDRGETTGQQAWEAGLGFQSCAQDTLS